MVVKSNSTDYLEAIDVETLQLTTIAAMNLDAQAWDYHVSGNNWAAPGWVLLSEDSYDANGHYLSRQIAAVELDGHGRRARRPPRPPPHALHGVLDAGVPRLGERRLHARRVPLQLVRRPDESQNILFFLELPPGALDAP